MSAVGKAYTVLVVFLCFPEPKKIEAELRKSASIE